MAKKQFKAESKKLMELMINSIYSNKEIFLREIISNASDAIDKLYYKSLTDKKIKVDKDDFEIKISIDKDNRLLTISDNGIGMSKEELENNLGTIARSGSSTFKEENEKKDDIDIIGQFGVGFYSAFMVSDNVKVVSRAYGSSASFVWESSGVSGYSIKECSLDDYGTSITLKIKEGSDYDQYLEDYTIQMLIKKYSDYITYPIKMNLEKSIKKDDEYETVYEEEVVNSLVPLWKRNKKDISKEDYDTFYSDKFFDYEKPLKVIHFSLEGMTNFNALLYIPSKAPFNYYSKEYEKGLQLYSNGVLIMEKCGDLLPDYFGFVKGVVDSPDLSLNISREMLQQDRVVKTIAKNIEKRISKELSTLMSDSRDVYEKFFDNFGLQLKAGICNNYGMDKDKLQDLILYKSSNGGYTSLKEYVSRMKSDQEFIYYACGDSESKASLLPQTEAVLSKDYEVLYLTEYGDEFTVQIINSYDEKLFKNVCDSDLSLASDDDKEKIKKVNEDNKDLLDFMKSDLDVKEVRFTNNLSKHPVCLVSEGSVSTQMEKAMKAIPNSDVKAVMILEINNNHPIADKLRKLYKKDKDSLKEYSKILYAQARLIEGLSVDNPTELSNLICDKLSS